jgi:hypothetical protein
VLGSRRGNIGKFYSERDLEVCDPLGPFYHSVLFLSSSVHRQLREAVSGNNFWTAHVELSTAMVSGIDDEILERVFVREMLRLQFFLMSQESLQRPTEPLNLFLVQEKGARLAHNYRRNRFEGREASHTSGRDNNRPLVDPWSGITSLFIGFARTFSFRLHRPVDQSFFFLSHGCSLFFLVLFLFSFIGWGCLPVVTVKFSCKS